MKTLTSKRKLFIIASWLFVAVCMAVIFYLSRERASVSSDRSNSVIELIVRLFNYRLTPHTVRKTAHALEYFGLTLAFNLAYGVTFKKFCPFLSMLSSIFYSATDEIHQYFVEGRACRGYDLLVDFYGTAIMTAILCIGYVILVKTMEKRGKQCPF